MTSPLGRNPPNLRGIPDDHHDVGNPGSYEPRRWHHPPESAGEGVPYSGQALWREEQESGKVLAETQGKWGESCIVEVGLIEKC